MAAPLSKLQKRNLALLALRAWRRESAIARGRGDRCLDFDTWRHHAIQAATGKLGLRCCSQDDYCDARGHLHHRLGEDDQALYWFNRGHGPKHREAEAVLWRTMEQAGRSPNYVEAICRSMFKCNLLEASTDQLWKLTYTMRHRKKQKHT